MQNTLGRTRLSRSVSWLAVAGLAGAALIGPGASGALATSLPPSVTPTPHEGNITECKEGYVTIFVNGNSGTGDDSVSAGGVTVNVHFDADNTLDWTATGGTISIVYVKGGNGYNEYDYSPAATSDTGLSAPLVGEGNVPDVSHAVFCANPNQTTTTSSESSESSSTSSESSESSSTSSVSSESSVSSTTSTTSSVASTTSTVASTTSTVASTTSSVASTTSSVEGTSSTSSSGEVLGVEGTPNVTLPPTSTLDAATATGSPDALRIVLLGLAVLLASILLLQPKGASSRK
jgi:hypothetical protein